MFEIFLTGATTYIAGVKKMRDLVIFRHFVTEILMTKVDFGVFFTHEKIHKSTFRVKISM